jgi:hypothetical protein
MHQRQSYTLLLDTYDAWGACMQQPCKQHEKAEVEQQLLRVSGQTPSHYTHPHRTILLLHLALRYINSNTHYNNGAFSDMAGTV